MLGSGCLAVNRISKTVTFPHPQLLLEHTILTGMLTSCRYSLVFLPHLIQFLFKTHVFKDTCPIYTLASHPPSLSIFYIALIFIYPSYYWNFMTFIFCPHLVQLKLKRTHSVWFNIISRRSLEKYRRQKYLWNE